MAIKVLILSYDFRPALGGVATCAYEIATNLARKQDYRVQVLAPLHPEADSVESAGFSVHRVSLSAKALLSIAGYKKALDEKIEQFQPDFLICLLWMPDGAAAFLQKKKIPYFLFAHGVEVFESYFSLRKIVRSFLAPFKRQVFDGAKEVWAVSGYTKEKVIHFCHTTAEKVFVLYNGVDEKHFSPGEKPVHLLEKHDLKNKFVLLTITRMEDYKGVDKVLQALSWINQNHPTLSKSMHYLIGGIGPDLERLQSLVDRHHLGSHVTFLGKVPAKELVDYYRVCDIFVMLSREDLKTPNVEGFGLVYLEAAACGKASLAGRSGGIPDAVIDNKTGWLCDPLNEKDVGQKLMELFNDQGKVLKMGEQAREYVVSKMNWKTMTDKIDHRIRAHVRN